MVGVMKTEMKQVIVLRKDLNMRKGKMVAQGAHASMKATLENLTRPEVVAWLAGAFTKIAVSVDSEDELKQVYENAKQKGLICSLILDAGLTEFDGVPTYTAVAVGPALRNKVDEVTGHLKLL
jgi:PTH2 family peptidyl-tRNA hydrolase